MLQRRLPLAVLKRVHVSYRFRLLLLVATALTACGIETQDRMATNFDNLNVATALTACGIETSFAFHMCHHTTSCNGAYRLRY